MSISALITGATGYIGGALARRLASENYEVHAIIRPQSRAERLEGFRGIKTHTHTGSVANLRSIFKEAAPKIVFHLASVFRASHEPSDVAPLIRSNLLFASQVAEAAVGSGVRFMVNTGTSWQHYRDADYDPVCLYAATKQAFESILEYYAGGFGLKVVTLVLSDTYGPGDFRPKLFSSLRNSALRGDRLNMSGGEQKLDLVYIDDVVEAYLKAAVHLQSGKVELPERYAVRTGKALPLREVVSLYKAAGGLVPDIDWGSRPYRPREMMLPWEGGKLLPGWEPAVMLEDGLRRMEAQYV